MPRSPRPPGRRRGALTSTRWSAGAGCCTSAASPPIRPTCGLPGRARRTGPPGPGGARGGRLGGRGGGRGCRLRRGCAPPADPTDLRLAWAGEAHGATVIHPGAASPARRWPPDRWAKVATAERAAGRRVVITGSPAEAGLARRVAREAGLDGWAVLAGRTDLRELAEVVAGAGAVVAGDTGVAHLATAFGKPSVTLFGPTPPALWGPPAAWRDRHVALWKGTTGDPHAGAPDPGLLRIEPEEVIAALRRLL